MHPPDVKVAPGQKSSWGRSPLISRKPVSGDYAATMPCGGTMGKSRRQFLTVTSAGLIGAAVAHSVCAQVPETQQQPAPGTPPAFGTGPLVGPEISPTTVSEAEKLVQIKMTDSEVAGAAARRNAKTGQ